jgi:solute carrier family 12 (potassium/chloride transporters), member 9
MVLCLSSTATYRCIINGDEDPNGRVDDVLADDQWWHDLKQLRYASTASTPIAASALAQASIAFVNSLADFSPTHWGERVVGVLARRGSTASTARPSLSLAPPKRRQSIAVLPHSVSMRMAVGKPEFFSHVSSESSSEDESTEEDLEEDDESDDDHAIASDGASEEYHSDPEPEPEPEEPQRSDYFSRHASGGVVKSPLDTPGRGAFSASAHASLDVDDDDKPHISFKPSPHPHRKHRIPELELDFNMLPSRAQYLILNDLIRSYSQDTGVVFTTLPAPTPGTYQDEEKSFEYVSGLELLCEDIPPVLLIHSNSLVVTLAL